MARVFVILTTYRRSHLLPRALKSLLSQTFADWVCEVHNDAPEDSGPREIVHALNDPRIVYCHHERNLGLVAAQNTVFRPRPEPYRALLEDDNWWEPELLESLLHVLDSHPKAQVAWSNMHKWREEPDGRWTDMKETIWPVSPEPGVRFFNWPSAAQVIGAVYSNGAALIRSPDFSKHVLPIDIVPGTTEALRERSFKSPLLLVEKPLANFSYTRESARAKHHPKFFLQQVLLAASFFDHASPGERLGLEIWGNGRHQPARSLNALIIGALLARNGTQWLRWTKLEDWIWFCGWSAKHPMDLMRGLRSKSILSGVWEYLRESTSHLARA